MNFIFKKVYPPDIEVFKKVFVESFYNCNSGKNLKRFNYLAKKTDTNFAGLDGFGLIAFDEDGNPAGCLGFYPILMELNGKEFLAAQIGDGGVLPEYRGKKLFTSMLRKVIEFAESHNVKMIIGLSSPNNPGSFKGVKKADFEEIKKIRRVYFPLRPALFAKLIRRINNKLYEVYESVCLFSYISKKKCLFENTHEVNDDIKVVRSEFYIDYKRCNNNCIIDFKSGYAWISVKPFELLVGDYLCKDGYEFEQLLSSLLSFCSMLGKDHLVFLENELPIISKAIKNKINKKQKGETCLMVHYLDKNLKKNNINFGYADFDTF